MWMGFCGRTLSWNREIRIDPYFPIIFSSKLIKKNMYVGWVQYDFLLLFHMSLGIGITNCHLNSLKPGMPVDKNCINECCLQKLMMVLSY